MYCLREIKHFFFCWKQEIDILSACHNHNGWFCFCWNQASPMISTSLIFKKSFFLPSHIDWLARSKDLKQCQAITFHLVWPFTLHWSHWLKAIRARWILITVTALFVFADAERSRDVWKKWRDTDIVMIRYTRYQQGAVVVACLVITVVTTLFQDQNTKKRPDFALSYTSHLTLSSGS